MAQKSVTITIEGMHCDACVGNLQTAFGALDGVDHADVAVGEARITFDDARCTMQDLIRAVSRAGDFRMTGFRFA